MTTSSLTWIRPLLLAALLPTAAFSEQTASYDSVGRLSIKGVWDSTVTLQVCGGGPVLRTFRALNLFAHDGSLVATSVAVPPPSLGKWRWLGGRKFRATSQLMRLGAGGVFEGMTRVSRDIEMAQDAQSFTSVVTTQLFDVTDTPIQEGCGKEVARRVY